MLDTVSAEGDTIVDMSFLVLHRGAEGLTKDEYNRVDGQNKIHNAIPVL